MFGLFDDFLQQPLILLQTGDFSFVVGHRARQAHAFVAKRSASRVWHHHRAQLLLVELQHNQGCSMKRQLIKLNYYEIMKNHERFVLMVVF